MNLKLHVWRQKGPADKGRFVTYDAPDPLEAPNVQIDAEFVEGDASRCDDATTEDVEDTCIVNDTTRNNIMFLDEDGNDVAHNLANGNLVLYDVFNVTGTALPIGGPTEACAPGFR